MSGLKRALGAAFVAALLGSSFAAGAAPAPKAGFATPPAVTIAHWRNNATAAYSLIHDDTCDGSKGPPAHGTYGLFDHWQEAAQRGLRIGLGAIALECTDQPGTVDFLRATLDAGYEIYSHSWFHCDHTQAPGQCEVWSDAAQAMLPVPQVYPELGLTTRQQLIDFEMQHSRAWLADRGNAGAGVDFYSFPYDLFDEFAIGRLPLAGYIGGRGGNRATGAINRWHINPDPSQGGDPLVDFRVVWDEYNPADTLGTPTNTSDYDPPSLANYLADVANGGLGGWGVQVLHGIEDLSFGTVALDTYRGHLDAMRALQDQGKLWIATPSEAIRYRRTNYHCGGARANADAVIGVDGNGNLLFPGLSDPSCPAYATEVTLVVTLPAGVDAIVATQNGATLTVKADATPGKVQVTANPVLGTINLQPVASPQAPAITSAATATFAVGAAGTFTATATGNPAPTFSFNGTLPPGLSLNAVTGVLSGTPVAAGSVQRTLVAANGLAPDASQAFTIVVAKGSQTIAFTPIDGLNLTEVDALLATATSGLPVSFASATPTVCSVSGVNLTVTGLAPGMCTLLATQAGDANWNAAPIATQSFFVKGTQAITFGSPPALSVGTTGTVIVSASSGLPVTLISWIPEFCTVTGNVVTGVAPGECILAANQGGNAFYYPALQVLQSIPVVKGTQVVVFGAAPAIAVGGVGPVSATASSGLPVTLASTTPGTCSIAGNLVSGLATGDCTINGVQLGDASYEPAPLATLTFPIFANAGSYSLVAARVGDGQGRIVSSPAGVDCGSACTVSFAAGSTVTLTAIAAPGSAFAGWTGACDGLGPCVVTMSAQRNVWATFTLFTSLPRLANISTRGVVGSGGEVMIGGFVIGGNVSKTVVVRAIGPSLAGFGVAGAIADPKLDLYSGNTLVASNDDWGTAANAAAIQASGFSPSDPHESAVLVTLAPGAYTALVSGNGGTGPGMVEVYELDPAQGPFANISTRGLVQQGDGVMIGGFVIQGNAPQTVVIRALGPSLASFGVTGVMSNPRLQLFSGQAIIASNDDWSGGANAAEIFARGFAPGDAREAAILVTLNPGAYTVIVSGADGGTGVGIVEVYAQ
jgi:hypothetical protein